MLVDERLKAKETKVKYDLEKKVAPDENYTEPMKLLYEYLKDATCPCFLHLQAFQIREDQVQNDIIECSLLADSKYEDIESIFGIKKETVEVFKELFFDTAAFTSKLEKISYVNRCTDKQKDLKLRAISLGPEFIFYNYGSSLPSDELQKNLMRRLYMTSAYKAMSMHYNSLTSETSKQAVEYAKLTLKAFETLEKFAPKASNDSEEFNTYLLSDYTASMGLPTSDIVNEDII